MFSESKHIYILMSFGKRGYLMSLLGMYYDFQEAFIVIRWFVNR